MTDNASENDIIALIADIFERRGAEAYLGEAVTMAEHMLQTAALAQAERAPDAVVAAALLHDIGHFVGEFGAYSPDDVEDRRHESEGARVLADRFPPRVTEPIRLHVAAKRYLCATDKTYLGQLSEASRHTLSLQGGPMSKAEVAAFRAEAFQEDAVRLRRWDDAGKAANVPTPDFDDFRPLLQRLASPR